MNHVDWSCGSCIWNCVSLFLPDGGENVDATEGALHVLELGTLASRELKVCQRLESSPCMDSGCPESTGAC